MENNYLLTENIVQPLKCSLCDHFLSVSPISIISEDGLKYKCGRCHPIKTHVETRAIMYENLAKHMTFPCIYKDCDEKLKWSQVKDHEKKCSRRTLMCPRLNCEDIIGINSFASHFKEKHREAYHSDKFVLNDIFNYYSLDLLEKDGKVYIIIFDYDDVRYGISVCALDPDDHQYELILDSDAKKVSLIFTKQDIIPFDEKTHCFKCVTGSCKSECHIYRYYKKGILKRMTTKLDRDFIKRTFVGRHLNHTINIVEVKQEEDEDDLDLDDDLIVKDMVIDEVNDEEDDVDVTKEEEIIRRVLECPNCFEYMQPPIHQCVTGHTICQKCKSTLEKCPTCQAEIQGTRNYTIEEVATSMKLPSSASEKANGEVTALSREITCPTVNCYDKYDIQTIGNHFKDKHMDHFHWNSFTVKNIYAYFNIDVLVRYGKTYVVLFDYTDTNFGITMCSVGGEDDCQYEIKLTTDDEKFSILATAQKIVPFNENEHCFKCIAGTCKDDAHKTRIRWKTLFKKMTTKFNRDSVNRTFNYKLLNYCVNVIDSRKVFLTELRLKRDVIFRHMFECPICKDYMVPPIHQCLSGHVLCNVCKDKVEKCPSCEAKIDTTRNYTLEQVSESVEVPCQFQSERCEVRASIKRIASHEADCPLRSKKPCIESEEQIA